MDKPQFYTSSVAVKSHSSMSLKQRGSNYSAWPLTLLLLLMLACMGASACIIVISDGQTVASWKVQPAVLLAIISSIWNYAAGTMIAIAVTITWWKNLFRGSTVRNLHYIWRRGGGFSWVSSFRAGVDARNIVLLASLIFLVQAFNNPLLQRSSHVVARNITVSDNIKLNIASPLPDGFLARVGKIPPRNIVGSREGMSVAQGLRWNTPMLTHNTTGFRCDGACSGKVQGTGFTSKCNSTTTTMDFSSPKNDHAPIFAIKSRLVYNETGAPIVVLRTLHASALDDSCIATLTIDECTIEASLVEYPIVIQENIVALNQEKLDDMTALSYYTSVGDLPTVVAGQGAGPLRSINNHFDNMVTNASLQVDHNTNRSIYSGGGQSELFFKTDRADYPETIIHKCGLLFSSPTNYCLRHMHQFLFRAAFQNGTDADTQKFGVERSNVLLIFQSNYHYLAAVLAAKLLVLVGLLFQVWAWWELRWNVSMSPIETASALGAPALQHGRGREALDMLKIVGDVGVIYSESVHNGRFDYPMPQMQPVYHY